MTPPPVKVWALKEKIPVLQPENLEDKNFLDELRAGKFDLFVVVAYGKILKKELLAIPKHGSINLHGSLLPKLRGSSPIETAILNDEKETGVSIILMDHLMDHGPIIAMGKLNLTKWPIPVNELSDAILRLGGALMGKTIPAWIKGEIKAIEQEHSKATFAKKIKKEDGEINMADDDYKNYLKFLAYKEWPKSYFFVKKNSENLRVIITDAVYSGGKFIIRKVVPEGKKEMAFTDFQKN
jgi:methionyl-tRNA formyltransferase